MAMKNNAILKVTRNKLQTKRKQDICKIFVQMLHLKGIVNIFDKAHDYRYTDVIWWGKINKAVLKVTRNIMQSMRR